MDTDTAVRDWVAATAVELTPETPPRPLAELVGDAVITGFGASTRQSHEILDLGHRLLRLLVAQKGYRAIALEDDESVIAELDTYVRTGSGDVAATLSHAFGPWRIAELVEILDWLRDRNRRHPDDQVRLFGLQPAGVRVGHYDEVLDWARAADADVAETVAPLYEILRTAHRIPEHVQTAQGIHPGRPFAEVAAEALAALRPLGEHPGLDLARRIAEFHASTVAAGYDFEAANARSANAMIDWHESTGAKIFYWEGMAHTANAPKVGIRQLRDMGGNPGSRLRDHYGDGYVSIVVGFDHGVIHGDVRIPEPPPEFADAVLGSAAPGTYLLDLRSAKPEPVARWLSGQHRLRVIAGVYKPEADAEHYLTGGPLDGWFDVIVRIRAITPTMMLG